MQSDVTVILKGEDCTFKKQFNCYEVYSMDWQDPTLLNLIELAKMEYTGEPDEVQLSIKVFW